MIVIERDGPCVIERTEPGRYAFRCRECWIQSPPLSRRDAEDLFHRHTHGEAE